MTTTPESPKVERVEAGSAQMHAGWISALRDALKAGGSVAFKKEAIQNLLDHLLASTPATLGREEVIETITPIMLRREADGQDSFAWVCEVADAILATNDAAGRREGEK